MSSFTKKGKRAVQLPPGTRLSPHNTQLLISSGIPSLDVLLGGGLALGSLILLEEDTFNLYGGVMNKYFMAEGAVSGHALVHVSADDDPGLLFKNLPGLYVSESSVSSVSKNLGSDPASTSNPPHPSPKASPEGTQDKMKIAWRYEHLSKTQMQGLRGLNDDFAHTFDLMKKLDVQEHVSCCPLALGSVSLSLNSPTRSLSVRLETLLASIREECTKIRPKVGEAPFTPLRLSIASLWSPSWSTDASEFPLLMSFLSSLRGLTRSTYTVCFVTIPSHLIKEPSLRYIYRLFDIVLSLKAFAGTQNELSPLFQDIDGLFFVRKMAALNCLIAPSPDAHDLSFKLKRKAFVIDHFSLPPDLGEAPSRDTQSKPVVSPQSGPSPAPSSSSSFQKRSKEGGPKMQIGVTSEGNGAPSTGKDVGTPSSDRSHSHSRLHNILDSHNHALCQPNPTKTNPLDF